MQTAATRLEETYHLVDLIERAQSKPGIVAPARVSPPRVALFVTGAKHDDFRLPLRSARRTAGDAGRKPNLVNGHLSETSSYRLRAPCFAARLIRADT